ncbi:MAG: HAMP domain-containing histidine kinase [Chloroflexi bacterium]|nr:HAMP domain-containing histidine kinase [Chloroflexota bacterium]
MATETTHLVRTVAHDLKSPLGAVKGYIDLIRHTGPLNERQQHFVQRALDGMTYMEHLIANLLTLSRVSGETPLEFGECDLHMLVREALDLAESQVLRRHLTVHFENNGVTTVAGDQRLLAQVVHNLLNNAIKYNRDGGDVWISLSREREVVRLSVRDNGIGIAAADLPHIFEQFYRSTAGVEHQVEGSGLGLAIVKTIVQQHQGQIHVESQLGQGSIFTVVLPRHTRPSEESETRSFDYPARYSEGHEGAHGLRAEMASEESDSVNDNLQESHHDSTSDSRNDSK